MSEEARQQQPERHSRLEQGAKFFGFTPWNHVVVTSVTHHDRADQPAERPARVGEREFLASSRQRDIDDGESSGHDAAADQEKLPVALRKAFGNLARNRFEPPGLFELELAPGALRNLAPRPFELARIAARSIDKRQQVQKSGRRIERVARHSELGSATLHHAIDAEAHRAFELCVAAERDDRVD